MSDKHKEVNGKSMLIKLVRQHKASCRNSECPISLCLIGIWLKEAGLIEDEDMKEFW